MKVLDSYKGKPLIHAWAYENRDGELLGAVARYQDAEGKKDVVPFFKPNGNGSFNVWIDLVIRPLFGLYKLANHDRSKAVLITEGEKCASAVQSMGLCAVTSLGGSNAAKQADWTPLNGCQMVFIVPDNDAAGEHYAEDVYNALMALPIPPVVKILRLSGLSVGGDIVDWLQGHTNNWDGYAAIDENLHDPLKKALATELKSAVPPPDSWGASELSSEWELPSEMTTKTLPVMPLTTELIPEPFRLWLADVSHRMQTPPDFATISTLVITSSLIGAGCGIRPKQQDNWEVIPNLWGACVGRPSVMLKSPSMKEPMSFLDRLQAGYAEQFEQAKIGADFDAMAGKTAIDGIKDKLTKAGKAGGDIRSLKAEYAELMQCAEPEPTRRLLKTNETSIQSMTVLQVQNPRGVLLFRDELMGLLGSWDRDDKSADRAYFLEAWNGNAPYNDFKIGRGVTDAKNICISLLGGIQPDKLNAYLYQAMKGGNDGLVQRLQLAVYPDETHGWQYVDTKPNKAEKERAFSIMENLAEIDFLEYGAVQGEHDDRPYFRFDDEAQQVFIQWLTELQTVKLIQDDSKLVTEHLGKYRSLMPSLALIFHCIDVADGRTQGNVSAKAARLAVEWCNYLESHARRIYAVAESPDHAAAVRLAEKIKAGALPSPFTAKDVYKNHWHGLGDRQEVDKACNVLIDENWLMMQRKPKTGTGRPPLPDYRINPLFL